MSAVKTTPLQIPSLSSFRADQANRIAAWRSPLRIPGYEAFTLVRIEQFEAEPDLSADRFVIDLEFGTDKFLATMSQRLLFDLFDALSADLRLDPFPLPDLAALMLEAVLLPLLQRLERFTGRSMKIAGVRSASAAEILQLGHSTAKGRDTGAVAPSDPRMTIYLSLRGPRLRQTLTLRGWADALDPLLNPWRVGLRPWDSLPLAFSFQAGATLLSRQLIASLRIGDAILLQDVFIASPFNGRSPLALQMVVADTLTTTARHTEDGWRIDGIPQCEWKAGQTMIDDTEIPSGATAPPDGFDVLPIRLVFEAARLELPLGELRRLGPGSLFHIDAAPGMVRIVANGQLIGNGELVSIDGRAGVRITAFSSDAGKGQSIKNEQ
jgi:type III secretion protein Q